MCAKLQRFAVLLTAACLLGCGSSETPERAAERTSKEAAKRLDRQAKKAKTARPGNWGRFSGPVETRWETDGVTMVLLNELRYTDPYGKVWVAPAGSRVDGASIPRPFWSIIGGPFEGKYRNASVLHDVAYDEQKVSPQEVDLMFYNAMRCAGVGATTAKTMYYVLLRHGRHWKHRQAQPVVRAPSRASAVAPGDVDEIQKWIQTNDPNLDEIEARAGAGGR